MWLVYTKVLGWCVMELQPRLRIGVIGSGRAGSAVAAAWQRAGHPIVGVTARSEVSQLRAAALLPGVPVVSEEEVCRDVDLILIAVPDDSLLAVMDGLVAEGHVTSAHLVVHLSGRFGIDLGVMGPIVLALHPAMTFTGTSVDRDRLTGAPWGVTAPESMRTIAEALVIEAGGEPVWIPESARVVYHAALSIASNYLNTVVSVAMDLLAEGGVEEPARLIGPLVHASATNALREGTHSLTGPVARGDAQTVRAHLDVLHEQDHLVARTYALLAQLTADRALAHGLLSMEQASAVIDAAQEQRT